MSHEEVRLLLNGWLENNAQLGVVGQLWGFGFALLRCRVTFVSDSTIGLVTIDGGKIEVDISEPGTEFKYAQPRELPEFASKHGLTDEQKLASSLMVLFPPREAGELTEGNAESISFRELVES
jgi:hypothetical protein